MKTYEKIKKEYAKGRYKIPTAFFTSLAFISLIVLVLLMFFNKPLTLTKIGLLILGGISGIILAQRNEHEEGYMEGYDIGKEDGQKTISDEIGFSDNETLLTQLRAAQEAVKEVKK